MKTSVIESKFVTSGSHRFEAKYYLNDNSLLSMVIEKHRSEAKELSDLADVFNPPVFKRQFCKKTERSVPYFQSSDVQYASEFSEVNVFKGQAESLNLLVKTSDILVTGFGTIGNVRLVSRHQNNVCYANNVCRIRVKDNILKGVIYAFMCSKYGSAQLNKNASGSVVRYIEAPGIKKTLIPNFSLSLQIQIDNLIEESTRLREEATDIENNAIEHLELYCNKNFDNRYAKHCGTINVSSITSSFNTRLDPPVFINEGVKWINKLNVEIKKLQDCNIKMWYPGIFKRSYVKKGYPYIKGSAMFNKNPFVSCEQLSKTRTPNIDELWLKDNMLLISCAGICGQVKLITKEYEEKKAIGSPDIIRLISNDSLITKEYLYAYLKLPGVYDYMQSLKYGSVIERFDIYNLNNLPIVVPTENLSLEVTNLIKIYAEKTYKAFILEEKAITLVEQEIEKWNK